MIHYIERSRAYYGAQGYPAYSWAQNDSAPFATMRKSLQDSRLVLLTTAAPFQPHLPDQGPGAAYNAAAKFFSVFTQAVEPTPDLRISHIGYDRVHCRADDPATWLPIAALKQALAGGRFASLAEELIGVPTNRSQRATRDVDAVDALAHCQRLNVDVALLVPT
jgi:hypothetical protein